MLKTLKMLLKINKRLKQTRMNNQNSKISLEILEGIEILTMKINQRKRITSLLLEGKSQERDTKKNLMNRETKAGRGALDKLRNTKKDSLHQKKKRMDFNLGVELLRRRGIFLKKIMMA